MRKAAGAGLVLAILLNGLGLPAHAIVETAVRKAAAFSATRDRTRSVNSRAALPNNSRPQQQPQPAAAPLVATKIAFASDRDGNFEIYTMDADGGGLARLTENNSEDFSPAWSPNGTQLAFVSNRDGNNEIYLMNADGTGQKRLTNNDADDLSPAWSPDGTRLAFSSRRDGNDEIYTMNANGTGLLNLTNNAGDDTQPSFSPDGSMIAFASNREVSQYEIYRMDDDGGGVVQLTSNEADDSNPNWSPGTITFQSDRDGDEDIYAMKASDGSSQTQLTNNAAAFDVEPFSSADGGRVAFASTRNDNFEIYMANADGTAPVRLTNNPANDIQPALQSQGVIPGPAASTLRFSAANYSVGEGGVTVTITVTRTGSSVGVATVEYATRNGTATDKGDYSPAFGTLRFNPGQTSRSFTVSIIDDAFIEPDEAVNLTLRNPTGASLGSQATAVLTILDNDSTILSTNPNPIDDAAFFIRQQYLDFLGREPEPAGLQFYLNILNGCAPFGLECVKYTRGAIAASFFRSPEFQRKGSYIIYLYMVSLGQRPATVAELSDPTKIERPHYAEFIADLQSISDPNDDPVIGEAKKVAFTEAWLQRPEIQQRFANLSNAQFVQKLVDTAGITFPSAYHNGLVSALNSGSLTRAQVLRMVAESSEVNAKFNKQAFVTMAYFALLHRDPDLPGYIFHNSRFQLAIHPDILENIIVRGFIESPEYRGRFGPP